MVDLKKIKIEMIKHDEKQSDLALAIGISRVHMNHLLTGKKKFTNMEIINKIAEHYGKNVSFFLTKKELKS